ncbi:hypothetical protein SLA2020_207630 [Shorea laevis]
MRRVKKANLPNSRTRNEEEREVQKWIHRNYGQKQGISKFQVSTTFPLPSTVSGFRRSRARERSKSKLL